MNVTAKWLAEKIQEFIVILNICLSETNFIEDRYMYEMDIVIAKNWLTRLNEGANAYLIANEIIDPATTKQFTDYWRQGVWGEMQSKALSVLQKNISLERSRE